MFRVAIIALTLVLATGADVRSQDAPEASPEAEVPERTSNRKIRMMDEMNAERRRDVAEDPGAYSDYSLPQHTSPGREQRGYYAGSGGSTPANPGGNAFGHGGSAYPSDGGRAYPTVPNNR